MTKASALEAYFQTRKFTINHKSKLEKKTQKKKKMLKKELQTKLSFNC
jgi:hypothetical protein